MAHATLPSLPAHSFPQVLSSSLDQMVERMLARPQLGSCDYSDDFEDCFADATVHVLGTDHEYCARHFRAVSRG